VRALVILWRKLRLKGLKLVVKFPRRLSVALLCCVQLFRNI
jgi:hypothetical protein